MHDDNIEGEDREPYSEDSESESSLTEHERKLDSDLFNETEAGEQGADSFDRELQRSLAETEKQVLQFDSGNQELQERGWSIARKEIEKFKPVPWFIWRLNNYVFTSSSGHTNLPEGLVLGMRKLLCRAAGDRFIGVGREVHTTRKALEILTPDLVAAICVVHAVCRRMKNMQFERIWGPILDDALLRAQLGYVVGDKNDEFGPGRGMLAGFAGRAGLAILIAGGDLEQARESLELLATGTQISKVGFKLYGCDPLQVSAMLLSASGCGRDAAFGTVGYSSITPGSLAAHLQVENEAQFSWLSAFAITELLRVGKDSMIDERFWLSMKHADQQSRSETLEMCTSLLHKGHGLGWMC
ncbi:MAG: hypothetical protein DCC75_07420 [Proteobacteria bacterium]|nr:MAG: hypothetical protein DCC75_07420 [Pseudomonadota bacterium]